jgi:signal transduction histidine kinase
VINLPELIKGNLYFLKFIAKRKKIKILVETENENLMITSDPQRIKQIMMNLTYILYKRTSKGYIKIRIELISDSDPMKIKITIENTGQGIETNELNNLFQKDIQNENGKVLGLGLKITNLLV